MKMFLIAVLALLTLNPSVVWGQSRLNRQSAGGTEGKYDVYIYLVQLPTRANGNWDAAAAKMVGDLYTNQYVKTDIGRQLQASYIVQDKNLMSNDSLWEVVRIKGKNGNKLNINMLRAWEKSSDVGDSLPDGSLASQYSLIGGNYSYSPQAYGVVWDASGIDRANDAVYKSGDGNRMVDEIDFAILQSPYYTYSTAGELANINSYVDSQNLAVTMGVDVVGAGNVVLASGARTLQRIWGYSPPRLSIRMIGNGQIGITYTGTQGQSGIIQSSSNPDGPWIEVSTVNRGEEIIRSMQRRRFFRALYQPAQ